MQKAEILAKRFHELYEELAPTFDYKTRRASRVEWKDVPPNNKNLMIAVCNRIIEDYEIEL